MHRHFVFAAVLIALASPALSSAQTPAETRERERDRIEREKERERDREQMRKDREQERRGAVFVEVRVRDQERQERQDRQERDQARRVRDAAGSLDTTVAFDARGTITVNCPQGAVIVTSSDRSEIKVRARTESGQIRFTSTGARATLEPASGRGCNEGQFEVTVPVGTRVSARSWSGSVSVRGVRGDVEARTHSADIEIRDAGRIDVESISGDITIAGASGESLIRTVSGDVDLASARGDVEVETVSGDVDLRDVVAKQIRSHTTSGDVNFSGQILADGRYEYDTHSGEIRLVLPADVGAQLSVSTFSGGLESDFPITLQAGKDHGSRRLSFTLGQGTARIIAETFSGDVTLSSTARRK